VGAVSATLGGMGDETLSDCGRSTWGTRGVSKTAQCIGILRLAQSPQWEGRRLSKSRACMRTQRRDEKVRRGAPFGPPRAAARTDGLSPPSAPTRPESGLIAGLEGRPSRPGRLSGREARAQTRSPRSGHESRPMSRGIRRDPGQPSTDIGNGEHCTCRAEALNFGNCPAPPCRRFRARPDGGPEAGGCELAGRRMPPDQGASPADTGLASESVKEAVTPR
jgi:hypothetical protein